MYWKEAGTFIVEEPDTVSWRYMLVWQKKVANKGVVQLQ